jgi:hypothetical protein
LENSRLAAMLHGDPNEIHSNNRFGVIIAPGLMQLQGFLAMNNWQPGHSMDVTLETPLVVPNSKAEYFPNTSNSGFNYSLEDDRKTFSTACIKQRTKSSQFFGLVIKTYGYELSHENISLKDSDWQTYSKIPLDLVSKILPQTTEYTLERAAAVGVSANAFVRTLKDHPEFLPDLFFPKAREQGDQAVLEQRIVLYMGGSHNTKPLRRLWLNVHEIKPNPLSERGMIATVSEANGLYALEMYFLKIPKIILPRILRRADAIK